MDKTIQQAMTGKRIDDIAIPIPDSTGKTGAPK